MPTMPDQPSTLDLVHPSGADPDARHAVTALEALREELLAIPEKQLVALNVDLDAAALLVLGTLPGIRSHRKAIAALVGEQHTSVIDRLELVAFAAMDAQAALRVEAREDIPALSAQVLKQRAVLLAEIRALIARDLLRPEVLRALPGTNGFKNQSLDLLMLATILETHWEVVAPRTGLELTDVHHAEALANALMTAVGVREQAGQSEASRMRQRAYTLLDRTYDEARRLLTFLRWREDDADEIAPSFRGRRQRRRKKPKRTAVASPPPPTT